MMRRALFAILMLTSGSALGADCPDEARASEIYQEGARALAEGRYNDAARQFAEADELCPHDVALGEAFRAVATADNPILCMELVERAERRDTLPERRQRLREACEGNVGKIVVRCPGTTCAASIDGQPAKLHEPVWVLKGDHVVDLRVDGGPVKPIPVTVRGGETVTLPSQRPATTPTPTPARAQVPDPDIVTSPPPQDSLGLHPAMFFVGLGLTVVSGAVLVWSGVDTLAANDDFKATSDPMLREDGIDGQLRTNVLIGVTAGLGAATVVLALFTDWSGEPSPVTIETDGTGGVLGWRRPF